MSRRENSFDKLALKKGLPANIDAERFILGSVLLDASRFIEIAGLNQEDFALEKHRRIYLRMFELHERGEKIDRITVAEELMRHNELESVDGLGYLVSLDDGMPHIANLESYIKIVRDKAALRRIIHASQHMMNRALMAEEDPTDILSESNQALQAIADGTKATQEFKTPGKIIRGFEGGINSFLDPSRRPKGISSGFTKLDEMTGGFRSGEMTILAARPSMGKTAFALNIAWHVATRLFQPVAIFSLEMSQESLLTRMLCAAARVDSQRFRTGYLNEQERQKLRAAANQMVEAPIYIDDSAAVGLMDVHAKVRRLKQSGSKVGLVVIDYLQLMGSKGRAENRNQEVSALSRGLKLMSKELDCPFLVLSQLSRATETRTGDHRPQLSDLRESGSIEQDADLVGFIFREEVYKRDREDLHGIAELILAKQRTGPVGTVPLVFLHAQTRFENRATDLGDIVDE